MSVVATGPGEGVKNISLEPASQNSEGFAPFGEWTKRHPRAYGIGTSMYECDPVANIIMGDPIADVYAVVAGENSCILALADGVNWGELPRLTARCAVAGCLQYLSENLHNATTTHAVMLSLLNGFHRAQDCIMQHNATMTTLCVAVVCQLKSSDRWGLCVVNVGDSLAFTYRRDKGVQEVTVGSHCENEERDMRCPGGSLGFVNGYNPDLRNLTFSYMAVDSGDIVFLTSDGVSDNFDPVVVQCRHCEIPDLTRSNSLDSMLDVIQRSAHRNAEKDLNVIRSDDYVTNCHTHDVPMARHRKMLDMMTEVIEEEGLEDSTSAAEVCAKLLFHVWRCTENKRTFMEGVHREDHGVQELRRQLRPARKREMTREMHELPGKLDHAAVVAFEVGHFSSNPIRPLGWNESSSGGRRASVLTTIFEFMRSVSSSSSRRTSDNDENYSESASSDSFEELFDISKQP